MCSPPRVISLLPDCIACRWCDEADGDGFAPRVDWWSFGILIYELLYGFTPFRGKKRDETFNNILKRPLNFPELPEVSDECKVRYPPQGAVVISLSKTISQEARHGMTVTLALDGHLPCVPTDVLAKKHHLRIVRQACHQLQSMHMYSIIQELHVNMRMLSWAVLNVTCICGTEIQIA